MTTQTMTRSDIHAKIDALSDAATQKLALYVEFLSYEDDNDDGFYDPANLRSLNESIEQYLHQKYIEEKLEEAIKQAENPETKWIPGKDVIKKARLRLAQMLTNKQTL